LIQSVPHYLLLKKIYSYGIRGKLLNLIESYLTNRLVKVKINNCYSEQSTDGFINSGVPQGSILGPLIFLLYITDLSDVVENCILFLYADDNSLFIPVDPNVGSVEVGNLIQSDLNCLSHWSGTWKLDFQASKSKEIVFHSPRRHMGNHANLTLNNEVILRGSTHKHLGMHLDENFNFNEHLTRVIVKCNTMLNPMKALRTSVRSRHLETRAMRGVA
jgi:hypothetical protein